MSETRIIGVDVWWDNKLQKFRKKRLNLEKIPISCRCPNCGKILAEKEDRDETTIHIELPWARGSAEALHNLKKLRISLNLHGGVCYTCFLDGFGKYGERGQALKAEFKADEIKFKENKDKIPLWINGKLLLVKKIIEIDQSSEFCTEETG